MPTIYNPNKRKGLFFIPSGAIKSESAAFSYSQSSYRVDESNPTPTITGETGGTFTATPEGLTLNSSTGEITLSSSVINSYTVTYTLPSGTFENRSLGIEAAAFASTQSFSFDGVDDYFETGSGNMGNVDLSTSYWLNTTAVGTWTPMWGFCIQAIGSTNSSFGRLYFYSNIGLRVAAGSNYGSTNLNDGDWHHIIETYTASTKVKNVYVDGNTTPEATVTLPSWFNPPTYGFAEITIGSYYPANTTYLYNGNLDECAVFNKVLSSEEITSIYNNGLPADLSSFNPLVWYRMGE